MGMTMDNDRIEREILIRAPLERVWAMVTEPGWWVGEGDPTGVELREGQTVVSEHEGYGSFPMRIERIEPMRSITYRWATTFPGQEPREGNSTLVQFTLAPEGEGTRLRVVESGFASLDAPEETRRKSREGNIEGWTQEMDGFRERAEKPATS
jgi:uncharacterized protein YndB with AHSA1/START domain